jgi:hypothetical protein
VFREDVTALHEARPALPLEGEWTLAGFCDHLATLEVWPEPPEWHGALRFRNWAFESAALDRALRQAGRSLQDVLGPHWTSDRLDPDHRIPDRRGYSDVRWFTATQILPSGECGFDPDTDGGVPPRSSASGPVSHL